MKECRRYHAFLEWEDETCNGKCTEEYERHNGLLEGLCEICRRKCK
jgi:hypothetical protein